MTWIFGLGSERDPMSLKLETRRRRWLNNVLRPEIHPDMMREYVAVHENMSKQIRCVSASGVYNCFGMVFAARRCAIVDDEDVEATIEDDQYHRLPWVPASWMPGDVVIYRLGGRIVHAGIISRIQHSLSGDESTVFVRSAWGDNGEYEHPIAEVPKLLGTPTEVIAQRFLLR